MWMDAHESMLPAVSTSRGPAMLILSSAFLAAAANGISMVAFPWLVLQRTGNATDASVVARRSDTALLVATLGGRHGGGLLRAPPRRDACRTCGGVGGRQSRFCEWRRRDRSLTTVVLAALAAAGHSTRRHDGTPVHVAGSGRAGELDSPTTQRLRGRSSTGLHHRPGHGGRLLTANHRRRQRHVGHRRGLRFLHPDDGPACHYPAQTDRIEANAPEGWCPGWSRTEVRVAQQGSCAPRPDRPPVTALYLPMESVLFPRYFTDRTRTLRSSAGY